MKECAEYNLSKYELDSLTEAVQKRFAQPGVVVTAGWQDAGDVIRTGALVQVELDGFVHTHLWVMTASPESAGSWECRPFSVKGLLDQCP